jgi:hypothetical protein
MAQIRLRRDQAANWTTVNPVLAAGEAGYELDTKKMKVGDGVTAWNSLPYFSSSLYVADDTSTVGEFTSSKTLKITGSGIITTTLTGDTLDIFGSGPALGITVVGDDSTGTNIADGETVKIAGANGITTAMSGDVLTITGNGSDAVANVLYVSKSGNDANNGQTLATSKLTIKAA